MAVSQQLREQMLRISVHFSLEELNLRMPASGGKPTTQRTDAPDFGALLSWRTKSPDAGLSRCANNSENRCSGFWRTTLLKNQISRCRPLAVSQQLGEQILRISGHYSLEELNLRMPAPGGEPTTPQRTNTPDFGALLSWRTKSPDAGLWRWANNSENRYSGFRRTILLKN